MEENNSSSLSEKLLNKSNSYVFYKNEHDKLINENKKLADKNNELIDKNNQLEKDIAELKRTVKKLENLEPEFRKLNNDSLKRLNFLKETFRSENNININLNKELLYATVFNDTIRESEWLFHKDFSLINGAANYSLVYSLYRILDDSRPKRILELGLGQTTKITSQYANHFDDVELTVMEGNKDWIDVFGEKLNITDNINIIHMDLETFEHGGENNLRFKDVLDVVGDEKFDLVVIDGPDGRITENGETRMLKYSRSNIWQLIPDNLADDFIILMDDYERVGEKNTMHHVGELLNENEIDFFTYSCFGTSKQFAVFSEKFKFIKWI